MSSIATGEKFRVFVCSRCYVCQEAVVFYLSELVRPPDHAIAAEVFQQTVFSGCELGLFSTMG